MSTCEEWDPSSYDVDADMESRVRQAQPEELSDEWIELNAQVFAAWHEWVGRLREHRERRKVRAAPAQWFRIQQRRFADLLQRGLGVSEPAGAYLSWRRRRLEELGRADDAKAMEGRQPWD